MPLNRWWKLTAAEWQIQDSWTESVTGTINGGGPEYTFQTMNGNILIHKK